MNECHWMRASRYVNTSACLYGPKNLEVKWVGGPVGADLEVVDVLITKCVAIYIRDMKRYACRS
jgi:hypothetical protein